jgi:H+/Cl- antiporter ClcA
MIHAALIGLFTAGVVALPKYLYLSFPDLPWFSPILILGVGAVALCLQRFVLNRGVQDQNYQGLGDLLVQVHSPQSSDSSLRWLIRGLISFLLSLFGGVAGSEGAAVEWAQAIQIKKHFRMQRWFQQVRRNDAAVALASAVSAAFVAPFAAVVLPIELGIGGSTSFAVIGALFAFIGTQFLGEQFALDKMDAQGLLYHFQFLSWRDWLGVILMGISGGVVGAGIIRFIKYTQESLLVLFQTQAWIRILAGSVLLFLIYTIYPPSHQPSAVLLEEVIWSKFSPSQITLLFFAQFLSFSVLLSGLGTVGALWPLYALGGCLGFCLNHWGLESLVDLGTAASLTGAAALWGAVLGTPISGALLAFEITQNLQVVVPCLVAGFMGNAIRQFLKTQRLLEQDLDRRGFHFVSGRSRAILDSISIREAMVTDFVLAYEKDSAADLQVKLKQSVYPFLPVANEQGVFKNLLTADLISDATEVPSSTLSWFLEAKDILYRSGVKCPTVKMNDRLSDVLQSFEEFPCIPVLSDEGRVQGLLFAYRFRYVYDREVARRSFDFVRRTER